MNVLVGNTYSSDSHMYVFVCVVSSNEIDSFRGTKDISKKTKCIYRMFHNFHILVILI